MKILKAATTLVLTLLLLLTPITTLGAGQEADRTKMSSAHQRVYDASLALYGEQGQVGHFLCTTTVVAKRPGEYLLLTAGHCVTGDDLPEDLKFFVSEQIVDQPVVGNPALQPVEVLKAENDDKYDFAILHLVSDKQYPVIPISFDVPKIEDKVYAVNFSLGVTKQVALGSVATAVISNEGSEGDCPICKGRYMVHLFSAGGASGAAIVDEKTNSIVGVGEFGFRGTTTGLGCETMTAFREWLEKPASASTSPKDQSQQSKRVSN